VGTIGWYITYKTGVWKPSPMTVGQQLYKKSVGLLEDPEESQEMAVGATILGYASAVLYLGARLPQIYKNYREKSCEGLSVLFFMLSVLGNLTYGMGVSHLDT
jgi:solute carrier family 66 (lysosomal lysine-arginine transporter), member 1